MCIRDRASTVPEIGATRTPSLGTMAIPSPMALPAKTGSFTSEMSITVPDLSLIHILLDSASFEKVFTLDDPTQLSRLERLIKGIPSEYLLIAEDIVAMLSRESDSVIDDNVLIALTDHISMRCV